MTTLDSMIAEVEDFLSSHGADRDKVTTLSASLTSSALSLTVADADVVDEGFIEIGDELLAVKQPTAGSTTVTVQPWGRGQRGTTAAAHNANARVATNPRFPRSRIKAEINTAISNLFPDLFAVAVDETNTVTSTKLTYPINAEAEGVLRVAVETIGPTGMWFPVQQVRFNYRANTAAYPTGKTVDIASRSGLTPGRKIQVTYLKQFGTLSSGASTLALAGVDESWRDLITLQVCSKLILALDASRLQTTTMEQQNRSNFVQAGNASQISRQMVGLYQVRLEQERRLLFQRYPSRIMHP